MTRARARRRTAALPAYDHVALFLPVSLVNDIKDACAKVDGLDGLDGSTQRPANAGPRTPAQRPVRMSPPLLSRRELRRLVAEMVD